jgi:type IV secretory pathway VirD2 relaxase
MGRGRKPDHERVPSLRALIRRGVQRQGGVHTGRGHAKPRRGLVAVRAPHALSRRCVIKARYVSLTRNGQKAASLHLTYLERDGVERDGSPGRLYGADETFTADEVKASLPGEPRQFRFIVSPEDGDRVDLTDFARRLMSQVEKDTGRRLIWAAVNHYNTDNPHVHVVIRGLDRDGDEVRIDGRYISQEMRWRAQEVLTRELGRRHDLEIAHERSIEITRERPTGIDRMIEGHLSSERVVTVGQLAEAPRSERAACLARLETLKRLGLARNENAGTWRLAADWKGELARMAKQADAVAHLARFMPGLAGHYRVLEPGSAVDGFEGVIKGKGLHDELGGAMFLAVEAPGRVAWYVPVTQSIADTVREGDRVRVASQTESWVKSTDRIVARAAQENGGIYDPVRHQSALEAVRQRQPPQGPNTPSPADLVTANLRRLERLQHYNLVARLPDGRWRVAPDLVAQLEAREHSHPQQRLRVQAVGVDEGQARDRGRAAEAADRAATGAQLAKQLGLVYVDQPERFRGRLYACPASPSGREYVRVVDLVTDRFTLVRKPPDALRLEGRMVSVAPDRQRGLSIEMDRGLSR